MKYYKLMTFLIVVLIISACSRVLISNRKQLNLIPSSSMLQMSFDQYGQFLEDYVISADGQKTEMVKHVGKNIQKAVEQYFIDNGLEDELKNYAWEFNLVESNEVNAWCMPGGKVVFYTGILPLTKDANGLAVVMGHEIAHAIAEHGNERMSQGLIAQLGGAALAVAVSEQPEQTQQLWMTAFGAGAQLGVLLPFSRLQEGEADHLGLIFMSMAGYNPNHAISFWRRMAEMKDGQAPPEFISTHPSDENRIAEIEKLIPKALKYYNTAASSTL
ncbi:MAG: M48 family metallopeptidase [Candidatus Marinimicrobia bacterium]|nr:M48 family metallopeptidase [Candidatus Neomarinimicrobiota bacterium]